MHACVRAARPCARRASLLSRLWCRVLRVPAVHRIALQVPGQTVDMLLLKYARATQRSPTDPALVFVAR